MENLENIATAVYFLFIIVCTIFGKYYKNGEKVPARLLFFLVGIVSFPVIGCIFWALGKIGNFMLIPFSDLF